MGFFPEPFEEAVGTDFQHAVINLLHPFVGRDGEYCAGLDMLFHQPGVRQVGEDIAVHDQEMLGQVWDELQGPHGAQGFGFQ